MKKRKWTADEKKILYDNIGKRSAEEIAEMVGRTPNAVKIYALRKRLSWRPGVRKNLIIEVLRLKFGKPEYFAPTREFYEAVGMTQMRFWALYRGECAPTEKEYNSLKKELGVSSEEIFENRQLKLFDNDPTRNNR